MAVASHAKLDMGHVLALLEAYQKADLQLIESDIEVLKTAAAMIDNGHPKSGIPFIMPLHCA